MTQDKLFANSVYLMFNTLLMAGLGFIFWLVCAHKFTPSQVGQGTTLVSASGLIGLAALLGTNATLVRFLPTSHDRERLVSTFFFMVAVVSLVISGVYVLALPMIAPPLAYIRHDLYYAGAFVLLSAASSLNSLTDSVFIALRSAVYNLLIDGVLQSVGKILLVVAITTLGAFGIFTAFGGAALLAGGVSLVVIRWRFFIKPARLISRAYFVRLLRFTFANYVASLLNISPILIIPIVLVNRLDSADAGYYYLAFTVVNVAFAAAYAVTTSLFAEASQEGQNARALLRHGALILGSFVLPTCAIFALFGHFILSAFGNDYASNGGTTLLLLALSGPLVAGYELCIVLLRMEDRMQEYLFVAAIYAFTIVGLAYAWAPGGIDRVALAWMVGNAVATVLGVVFVVRVFRARNTEPSKPAPSLVS